MIHYTESIRGRVTLGVKERVTELAKSTPGGESGVVREAVEFYLTSKLADGTATLPGRSPARPYTPRRKRKIS